MVCIVEWSGGGLTGFNNRFMLLEQEVRSTLNGNLLKDGHNLLKKLKQFTVVDTSTAVAHVLVSHMIYHKF